MTLEPKDPKNRSETIVPSPSKCSQNESAFDSLRVLADWRRIPFLMVDSPHTKRMEDAVATKNYSDKSHWTADLKVIYPLPLEKPVSLHEHQEQLCLGVRDRVDSRGIRAPHISLVRAENLTKLTDRQAEAFLDGREHTVTGIAGQHVPRPDVVNRLRHHLKLVRATALRISSWNNRILTPEHSVEILASYAQDAAMRASRTLPLCPTLVVLRPQETRTLTAADLKRLKQNYELKSEQVVVAAGRSVPTLLEKGELPKQHDALRLKERGNSGAINMTQLMCALLGIEPLPEDLVRHGLRPDSEMDRWKRGGPLPEPLLTAVIQKRNEAKEILKDFVVG